MSSVVRAWRVAGYRGGMDNYMKHAGEQYASAVAAEVRAAMARKNVRQHELAAALGVSAMAMSRRVSGRIAFDVRELAEVAAYLRVDVGSLLPTLVIRQYAGLAA